MSLHVSPAERRFVKLGEEPPLRPHTGPPDFFLLLKNIPGRLVPSGCGWRIGKIRGGRAVDARIRKDLRGGRMGDLTKGAPERRRRHQHQQPLDCFRNFLISTNYLCRKMLRLERICVSKWEIKDCGAVHFNLSTEG